MKNRPGLFVLLGFLTACALDVACPRPAEPEDKLRIRLNPRVVFRGQTIHLTCRVEPHKDNRYLEWGVDFYRQSRDPLDGADAKITHERFIDGIPCNVGKPFCRLIRTNEEVLLTAELTVSGCEDGPSEDLRPSPDPF